MVRLGFIAEGATEKIILEKSDFFAHLKSLRIDFIPEVIDAGGNGNLLPRNILPLTQVLEDKGATHIIVLTDLDNDTCITQTKARIGAPYNHIVCICVKTVEAWFLADTQAMQSFYNDDTFFFELPENVPNPFEEIRAIRVNLLGRGLGNNKLVLANSLTQNHNFSILSAANHPNCESARYFLAKIQSFV